MTWNPKALGEFTSLLSRELSMADESLLQSLITKSRCSNQHAITRMKTQSASISASASFDTGDEEEEEDEIGEPSSKARKTGNDEKRRNDSCKKWDKEHSAFAVEALVERAMRGEKCHKTFKPPALLHVVEEVNKEFKTDYNIENLRNHLKFLKKRWKDITWLMDKVSGAGWDQQEKKIVLDKVIADGLIKGKSCRKHYINVSLPYDLDQLRIVCGIGHARGTFKKSSFATLGKSQEQLITVPITVDGEPTNASIPMESSIPHVSDESFTIPSEYENKQKGKMVDGSSSSGKKRKEDATIEAMEKFVDCMKWFGDAIITAHSQDHSQIVLKELNAIVMGIPGQYTREEKDKAFMFLAKNEHYSKVFLAKPKDIQEDEVGAIIRGLYSGKLQP